jgi:PAS domain S-box-containing protein
MVIYLSTRLTFYFLYFIMWLMKEKILKVGRRFFKPPVFAQDEKNQAVSQIYAILWIQILSIIAIAIVLSVLVPAFVRYWLTLTFSTIVISLALLELTRRGRTCLSSILLVIELWALITFFAWTATGIGARAAWGYFIVVFIAGMLLGRIAGIIMAGICSLTTLAIAFLSPVVSPHPLQFWLTNTMYLVFVILLQFLASRSIRESLDKANQQLHERQKAEREKEQVISLQKATIESTADGILVIDHAGKITDLNQRFAKMWRIPDAVLAARDDAQALNFVLEQLLDPQGFVAKVQELYAAPNQESFDLLRFKDGRCFERFSRPQLIAGQPVGRVWSFRDISERKQAEEELQKLASVVHHSSELINLATIDGKMIFLNKAGSKMLGISPAEVNQTNIMQVIPAHLKEMVEKELLPTVLNTGNWSGDMQYLNIKTGQLKDFHSITFVIKDPGTGKTLYLANVSSDITERKLGEEKLLESERRYRTLFESAGDAIFLLYRNQIIDCNSRTLEMFGCPREQIVGMPISRFHPPRQPDNSDSLSKGKEKNAAALSGDSQFFQWRHIRFDGTHFDAEVNLNRIELAAGPHLLAIVRDITERKMLEEQLRQAQKMEAVGILAGGVAHDFNNILSTIVGYASLLQMQAGLDKKLKEYLERILASTERAASLTHSLLAFSRKQAIELQPVDINDAIFGFHKVLARLIGEDIDFKLNLASENLVVDADIRQFEQVLMNLATNSRDAMPHGGKLTITTRSEVLTDGVGEIPRGAYAVISVYDTGTGMDSEIQSHLFEPFYTTKEVGKGTGLGLAIVYGIVKNHQGFIKIDSESAQGAAFHIYLPLKPLAVQKDRGKMQPEIPRGTETILLVEDDAAVRHVTKSMLEEFGYTVLEAADGMEALAVFAQHQDQVRLLLSDLIMPKKNGKETRAEIMKLKPGIKTIFMSGYTSDIIARKGILDPGTHLLLKPLHPTDLLEKVREVLDS